MHSRSIFRKSSKARRRQKPRSLRAENRAAVICFLLPSLAGVCTFYLLPFFEVLRRSVTDALGHGFVGLENYRSVLKNPAFQLAAGNTARFLCACIPLLLAFSLLLALPIYAMRPAGRPFQTTFLLPMAIPVASIVLLWKVLFAGHGLCNRVLSALGAAPVDFMGTGAAFWVLILTYLWKNSGYAMILWLAGLGHIPQEQYEAAAVDGATARQAFWHITRPGLRPTFWLTALLSLINSFKVFREAYLVAGQYPHESIYLLQHLFNNWFLSLDLGRMTAGAVLIVLAGLAAALIVWVVMRCFYKRQRRRAGRKQAKGTE